MKTTPTKEKEMNNPAAEGCKAAKEDNRIDKKERKYKVSFKEFLFGKIYESNKGHKLHRRGDGSWVVVWKNAGTDVYASYNEAREAVIDYQRKGK